MMNARQSQSPESVVREIRRNTRRKYSTESLQELESAVIRIDQRLAEIKTELASINRKTVDKDDVTAGLSSFGPVWDELYPAEKTRIVNLLIERVEYDAQAGELRIGFNTDYA